MLRLLACSVLFLIACSADVLSQPLSAFTDIQNEVMVWDRGFLRKIDYLPPTEMKIGRVAIPYLDNSRSFKIYYGGGVKTINAGFTNAFYVTDNLVGYLNQKSLNVFDRGVTKNLTGICNSYTIADSVVLYVDGVKNTYNAYYNGQIYTIESFLPDSILSNVKVSHNIIAYDNFANLFRIFYHGQIIAQEDFTVASFDAGRNTVAYVDANHQFKIFHNGQTYVIDDYPPISYAAGDDLVAYVSNDGYFKVFYEDSVHAIGYFNPTYRVKDNIIAYKDPTGYFDVFYKGQTTNLENYYPTSFKIQYNSVAYVNSSSTLRLFTEGEVYDVTNADLQSWQLNYDVLQYQIGQSVFKVFYKGLEY